MAGLTRRRVLLLAACAVILLVLAEGCARAASPYLREPMRFGDQATQVKVAQMDQLGPACTDVVLAGNSMGRDAFDPLAFRAAMPSQARAYNASLDAASPALLRRWLDDQVVPRLQPTTVVLTIASLDLNARGAATQSALAAYDEAPATQAGPVGVVQAWFVEHSALIRHRRELRDPDALATAVEQWRAGTPAERASPAGIPGVLGAEGQGLSRRPLRYRGDAGTKAFTRQQLLAGYTIDTAQLDAAGATIDDLRRRGIQVAVVVLPVTEDYLDLHPRGRADHDDFLRAVREVTTRSGVPLVDLHDQAPGPEIFADTHHLNASGASWFSTTLADALTRHGLAGTVRCPA